MKQVNQIIAPKCLLGWDLATWGPSHHLGTGKSLPTLRLPHQFCISEPSIPSVQQRAAEAWLSGAASSGPSLPPSLPLETQLALKGSALGVCLCGSEGCQGPQGALHSWHLPRYLRCLASPWTHPKEPTQHRVHVPKVGLNPEGSQRQGQLQERKAEGLYLGGLL